MDNKLTNIENLQNRVMAKIAGRELDDYYAQANQQNASYGLPPAGQTPPKVKSQGTTKSRVPKTPKSAIPTPGTPTPNPAPQAAPAAAVKPNVQLPAAQFEQRMLSRGGKAALGLGAVQGAYDLWNADDKVEGLGQAASDILPGAAMYGITRPGAGAAMSAAAGRAGSALSNLSQRSGLTGMAKDVNQNAIAPVMQRINPAMQRINPAMQAAGQAIKNKLPAGVVAAAGKAMPALARFGGKALSNIIPGAGAAMSGASAANRWQEGDRAGALMDAGLGAASFIPYVGGAINLAGSGLMGLRDSYRANNSAPAAQTTQAAPQQPRLTPKLSALTLYKQAASNFRRDLEDPSSGYNSDLHQAIAPMVSPSMEGLSPSSPDARRIQGLQGDLRKGLVGLEYLTGLKKNTGETFYDEHPTEAVATDLLGKSPLIGAGVAAGGVGLNYLRQAKNMSMTQPSAMSREGNSLDPSNSSNLLDPAKGNLRADVTRVFGDDENAAARLKILDRLNKSAPGKGFTKDYERLAQAKAAIEAKHGKVLDQLNKQLESPSISEKDVKRVQARINAIEKAQAHQTASIDKNIKALLTQAKSSRGASALPEYANFHESLQKANRQGGLKGYVGEGLHDHLGDGEISSWIKKNILPGRDQAIGDLLEKHKLTGQNPHFDDMLIKDIIRENKGGAPLHPDFNETTLRSIADPEHQSSGLRRSLRKMKFPLAAGAGIAAGGTGLYYLLKAMQNQMHPKDKTDEWKRTLLKSRGDFEGANRIG